MAGKDEVVDAFEIVLEEVDRAIKELNDRGSQAFQSRNYDLAKDLTDKGLKMTAFRDKVLNLEKEWNSLSSYVPKSIDRKTNEIKRKYLIRGMRTLQKEFRIPILQVLSRTEKGIAHNKYVIEKVGELMKYKLNDYDKEKASDQAQDVRWIHAVHWERYKMVKDGLLKNDSPIGIWEITEEGRKWLNDNMKNR